MKKKVALALMSLLTLSTTIDNYSNIWASEATIDIVSAIPKDAITVTRSESVTLKHDYVVIVDRSALPSNDYRQKVDKFVKRLVDSLGESDRVAIGYGTSKSSRLKLTQPLTSDKAAISKQLETDSKVLNSTFDTYPAYGDPTNVYTYLENESTLAVDRQFLYISDGNGGNAVFTSKHSLGALSNESVFDFMKRMNIDFHPVVLGSKDSTFAKQFTDNGIQASIYDEFFSRDSEKIDLPSLPTNEVTIDITSNSSYLTLKKAWLLTEDKKEIPLKVESNAVHDKVTLDHGKQYFVMYQFTGRVENEADEMTVSISNSRHSILEASSTIQKNLKAIELD